MASSLHYLSPWLPSLAVAACPGSDRVRWDEARRVGRGWMRIYSGTHGSLSVSPSHGSHLGWCLWWFHACSSWHLASSSGEWIGRDGNLLGRVRGGNVVMGRWLYKLRGFFFPGMFETANVHGLKTPFWYHSCMTLKMIYEQSRFSRLICPAGWFQTACHQQKAKLTRGSQIKNTFFGGICAISTSTAKSTGRQIYHWF